MFKIIFNSRMSEKNNNEFSHIFDIFSYLPVVIYQVKNRLSISSKNKDLFQIETIEINYLNDYLIELTGWQYQDIIQNPKWWLENIHPEDINIIIENTNHLYQNILNQTIKLPYKIKHEYRFKKKDQSWLYILDIFIIIENIEKINSYEYILNATGLWIDISREQQYYEIFKAIEEAPFLAIFIHQGKYVYANKSAIDWCGYSMEELKNLNAEELVVPEQRKYFTGNIEKRLKGEKFQFIYDNVKGLTKNQEIRDLMVISYSITYNGKPSGILFTLDQTEKKLYEKLFYALKDINQTIIRVLQKEDLFNEILNILIQKEICNNAYIIIKEAPNYKITAQKHKTSEQSLSLTDPCKNILEASLKKNQIQIIDKKEFINKVFPEQHIYLCITIPLITPKEEYILLLTIKEKITEDYFPKLIELYEDLKEDIEFALLKIQNEKLMKLLLEAVSKSPDWILVLNPDQSIDFCNDSVISLSKYNKEELLNHNYDIFIHDSLSKNLFLTKWKEVTQGNIVNNITSYFSKDGKLFFLDETWIPVKFHPKSNQIDKVVVLAKDITKERYLQEQYHKTLYYDIITGLFNRNGFTESLKALIKSYKEINIYISLFILDIDNFTYFKHLFGAENGETIFNLFVEKIKVLLEQFCNQYSIREDFVIMGRTGGDEIAIAFFDFNSTLIDNITKNFITFLEKNSFLKIHFNNQFFDIFFRTGISIYNKDSNHIEDIIDYATTALQFAKKEDLNYKIFKPELKNFITSYTETKQMIINAINKKNMVIYYQPYYNIEQQSIAGLEALMRLKDDNNQLIMPGTFIDVLEESQLLFDAELLLLEKISFFIKQLKSENLSIPISINISYKSFKNEQFIKQLIDLQKSFQYPLIIEITERLFAEDINTCNNIIKELEKANIKTYIDDFGTGYSSLIYLDKLYAHGIKIDKTFIDGIDQNNKKLSILKTIFELAKQLTMTTIIEGIETKSQLQILQQLGAKYGQGYFFNKPISDNIIIELLKHPK
ncbi:MAG: hypothetical protein KatS3mg129_0060 [Leptospiraceae bacterium]|nr:MAG: hypothetical protein KatS3mg129_0060 [Leptospiraceae bacterium]